MEIPRQFAENLRNIFCKVFVRVSLLLRESETTIKIKFAFFRGGGQGGREENCPKRYFSWETS